MLAGQSAMDGVQSVRNDALNCCVIKSHAHAALLG